MTRRQADPPEWATPCPWCHATPGNRCTSPRGRRLQITSHDARINAWSRQQARAQKTGDPK